MSENIVAPGGVVERVRPLFARLKPETAKALEDYRKVLETVLPLKARHRDSLPRDVERLSRELTVERGPGPRANYLAGPANQSAYLYYFLPWNLYRLCRLLPGLDFDAPDGATILDLGAGPLTLAQALWISRPHLRQRALRLVCVDQTSHILRVGRALFEALAGRDTPWRLELVHAPIHLAPREPVDIVAAVNAVNELGRGRGVEGHEALERLAVSLAERLTPAGRLLLVEPGTRQGGRTLSRLRGLFLEEGLSCLGPCVHGEDCPMLAPGWRSWCHFSVPAEAAPGWLGRLSALAGLEKGMVSLSYLEMAAAERRHAENQARIVSGTFPLPGGFGCYACAGSGLNLLTAPTRLPGLVSGALAELAWPERRGRDPKTGAWLCSVRER